MRYSFTDQDGNTWTQVGINGTMRAGDIAALDDPNETMVVDSDGHIEPSRIRPYPGSATIWTVKERYSSVQAWGLTYDGAPISKMVNSFSHNPHGFCVYRNIGVTVCPLNNL